MNAWVAGNFTGDIIANQLYVGYDINFLSDERIKTNIQELDDNEALASFRQLKPCKYNYKEPLLSGRTENEVYGFIAQEIADVLPHAVKIGNIKETKQGHIPNIMTICDISSNDGRVCVTLIDPININTIVEGGYDFSNSDISNNVITKNINEFEKNTEDEYQPLIFYDKNTKIYECKITEVIDETTFIVDELNVENDNMINENQLLLYGQKPDDFHRLNKNVIFTVTAAALQEVDRIQQQQQTEIEELKARLSALEK